MRLVLSLAILVAAGSPLSAQQMPEDLAKAKMMAEQRTTELLAKRRVPLERTVTGAPYSAEFVVESSQTLADGNHIAQRSTGRVYRDGEGRTRREEDRSNGSAIVSIVDPVAGVSYSLDPDARIAWKSPTLDAEKIMKMAELSRQKEEAMMRSGSADSSKAASELEAQRKRELEKATAAATARREPSGGEKEHIEGPLESKTIEGVGVTGRRSTTTLKAGAIGNDLPITITSEEWSSPDLQILVITRHNDPRSGESSYRLTNIVRAEPDRSLFLVPAEYTVKEAGMVRNFVMQ
jgi:hypothetical protein